METDQNKGDYDGNMALWGFPCSSARIAKSEPYFGAQPVRYHKIRGFGNPLRAVAQKVLKNHLV